MSDNKMRNFLLSDEALEVFTLLYNKGPKEDEDLPSKAGMAALIDAGLAKKDPQDPNVNMLTKLGNHEAGVYFTLQAVNANQKGTPVTVEVAGKTLHVDIDPADPDPVGTVEFIQAEVLKANGGDGANEVQSA
ncbi:hypothetical protein D3C75_864490 [compost metagenome]